ncbi:alpha/beta hydrolase [Leptospira perolatii]|uniref:Alpha/beta hydrolase n=1 Tax=Leptospira perolatii TaxID=2023191 RepID=A0A2M9ZNQ1_9LEPT|nr:alpha/beta hydrolase [Leptospira perolatii]PJZ69699.1 alpha/beta hydrolase [Leptospira perolatii]PJZ73706.1 alpha/beta hydrolase [Leptospira perolatii]
MKRKTFQFRNLQLSYIVSGPENSTPVLITHANGFSAGCYSYYIEKLSETHRVFALDFCGHGQSQVSLDWKEWTFFRDQILALIETEGLKNLVGIGHSLGGASQLLASYHSPQFYKKLIIMDPVILDPIAILLGKIFGRKLAKGALARRSEFASLDLIRKGYRRTPTFSRWDPKIFEDYLQSCFRQTENGKIILCCPPQLEAKIFSTASIRSLFQYRNIKTETHITIPEKYEVCSPKAARRIQSGNPNSSLEFWKGSTHFFPFEEPERTWDRIQRAL